MSGRERSTPGDPHLAVRPFLAARPGELEPAQARQLTEHLSRCPACADEAAGFHRIAAGLAVMRGLELEPPGDLLDSLLTLTAHRRSLLALRAAIQPRSRAARALAQGYGRGIQDPRLVAAAAGAGGAIVATAVVAGVLHSRRRVGTRGRLAAVARLEPRLLAMGGARSGLGRLRRPDRPALPVPVLGTLTARAR